jgi:hypothetical protein
MGVFTIGFAHRPCDPLDSVHYGFAFNPLTAGESWPFEIFPDSWVSFAPDISDTLKTCLAASQESALAKLLCRYPGDLSRRAISLLARA